MFSLIKGQKVLKVLSANSFIETLIDETPFEKSISTTNFRLSPTKNFCMV